MQILEVEIRNFRSIRHESVILDDYSLLIGPNNSGKSNLVDAIRAFYEQASFKARRDCPRFDNPSPESWVEIEFLLSESEYANLDERWQNDDRTLRVRNYMHKGEHKGFWAYEPGSDDPSGQFCSKKDVKSGLLGTPIYIPAAGKLDDFAKLTGPSPMRELVNAVVGKLVRSSSAFEKLKQDFETFSEEFQREETEDSQSLRDVTKHIYNALSDWGASFKLGIDSVDEDDIVKRLINFRILESELDGEEMEAEELGQGFQRNLIYTLIRLSAEYTETSSSQGSGKFAPVLSLLLFEEPEAFLHPPQARVLSKSLQKLAAQPGQQVLATSHSPTFVSFRQEDVCAIARLHRDAGETIIGQVSPDHLENIFHLNQDLNTLVEGTTYEAHKDDLRSDMEAVKYFMWLDSSRSGLFFATHVLLVEGPTERVLLNRLIQTGEINLPDDQVFILDCLGKFNIHRFMNLLGPLRITHSVLLDADEQKPPHPAIRQLIERSANDYTCGIDSFDDDFESFLGISSPGSPHRKPQHVMLKHVESQISEDRIRELEKKLSEIIGMRRRGA